MPVGYIVMERIIGKYLSEAEVRTHAVEIHKLIDILYDNGITHNDLHNRNILKGYTESLQAKEPRIYIIDYGSSLIGKPPIEQKKREYRIAITFEGGNTHRSYKTFVTV
jgi:tRNA A-37 threonylcarbamoyl transferase component Bud32